MLENTKYRLKKEKKLRIGYFGGSITEGSGASSWHKTSWRARLTAHLREAYPEAEITEIMAAVGGTGTDLGLCRCGLLRQLCLQGLQLSHHIRRLAALILDYSALPFHLFHLLTLISAEEAHAGYSLAHYQEQERKQDTYHVARSCFHKLEKIPELRNLTAIRSKNVPGLNNLFVVFAFDFLYAFNYTINNQISKIFARFNHIFIIIAKRTMLFAHFNQNRHYYERKD